MSRYKPTPKQTEFAAFAMIVFAAAALILVFLHQGTKKGAYTPRGYHEIVNYLIAEKILTATPVPHTGNRKYEIKFDAGGSEALAHFKDNSNLGDDIDDFNRDQRGLFRVKGGEITVDETYHAIASPDSGKYAWQGTLRYMTEQKGCGFLGKDSSIFLDPPERDMLPYSAHENARKEWNVKGSEKMAGSYFSLKWGDREPFGSIEYVGDNVVLRIKKKTPVVLVNGIRIVGVGIRLDDGDLVRFRDTSAASGQSRSFVFRSHEAAGVLSSYRSVNGRKRRLSEPGIPDLAETLAGRIDLVCRRRNRENSGPKTVFLSIAPELDGQVQSKLNNYVFQTLDHGSRTNIKKPASVTLMDARNGRLLALASYPTAEMLAEAGIEKRILTVNHNFRRHAIGSAVKPLLSWAIWDTYPHLASLEIRASNADQDSPLGIRLTEAFHNSLNGFGGVVFDRRSFIRHSYNLYMVSLGLLAISHDCKSGEVQFDTARQGFSWGSFQRNGSRIALDRSPKLNYCADNLKCTDLQTEPMLLKMKRLYDIDVAFNTEPQWDYGPVSEVLKELSISDGDGGRERLFFNESCPEKVNLEVDNIYYLKEQFISFLLGGGSCYWTNVKLAEAMARIGTGRKVTATLASVTENKPEFEDVVTDEPNSLTWIREVLAEPVMRGGTADDLGAVLADLQAEAAQKGRTLYFLCKTGSLNQRTRKTPNGLVLGELIFYMGFGVGSQGEPAVSGSIYIEGRGDAHEAVKFAMEILPDIYDYLKKQAAGP